MYPSRSAPKPEVAADEALGASWASALDPEGASEAGGAEGGPRLRVMEILRPSKSKDS